MRQKKKIEEQEKKLITGIRKNIYVAWIYMYIYMSK